MTKLIDIHTCEMSLSDLVSLALAGTEVILTDGEEPRVRLLAVPSKRIAGLHEGAIRISEDFTDPLPETFWLNGE